MSVIEQFFCKHIFVPKEKLYDEIWIKTFYGFIIERYRKLVIKEQCVKCGKKKIIEKKVDVV